MFPTKTLIAISLIFTLLLSSCGRSGAGEIGFTPILTPLRISIDTSGRLSFSVSRELIPTPIGTFDIAVNYGFDLDSVEEKYAKEKVLIIRVNKEAKVYKLDEDESFRVEFSGGDTLYKQVNIEYRANGTVILELETVSAGSAASSTTDVSVQNPTPNQELPTSPVASLETSTPSYNDESPFFMVRRVTDEDLQGKSTWELDVMRNEIYARHGRRFNRQDLQNYFDNQPWYQPTYSPEEFDTSLLTSTQCQNAVFIKRYQGDDNVKTC